MPPPPSLSLLFLPLLCAPFYFFGIISFVTTTPDKLNFQSQVHVSQISVIVPIRLKFKFYAVFIDWSNRMDFSFLGRQDIVHDWDIPSKVPKNYQKSLEPKITPHDCWETFVEMSLCDQLICFAGFVGMTLLAVLFQLPPSDSFLSVCLPTLFAAVLKFFLPLTTSANSGTANYNRSAPTRFAAGMIYLRKNGIEVLPLTRAGAPNPRPCCPPIPL